MNIQINGLDLAVIAAYLVGTTVFGGSFYFRRGSGGAADDFTKGGGRLPGWALALSVFATYVSSISFLALPAKAYLESWNALVLSFSIPFAATVAAIWFVPFYRRQTSASAYSFLEARFGVWARLYASSCFLVMQSVRSGMILFLLALLLKTMLGFSVPAVICAVGLATTLYAMMGGLRAVVWTDAVQAIILIVGALVCLVVLACSLPDGLAEDYRKRFARGEVQARGQIRFLRLATVGLGAFAVGVALCAMNVTSVLTAWWGLQSVLSGGMLGLFLLGAFARRTRPVQAAVATGVGILAVVWIVFGARAFGLPQILHVNLAIVVGTLALVLTGFALLPFGDRK